MIFTLHYEREFAMNDKVFEIGNRPWSDDELRSAVPKFASVFDARPIPDNHGGMGFIDMFFTWFVMCKLNPVAVLEVGVFKGQGTWLMETTLPNTIIHSVDVDLGQRQYVSSRAIYHAEDPTFESWDFPKGDVLAHFDDHQDAIDRIRFCVTEGIRYIVFTDNYPYQCGDCRSLKRGFEEPQANRYLHSALAVYFEFPPLLKTPKHRNDRPWTWPTPNPLFVDAKDLPASAVKDTTTYTWFCFAELKGDWTK